MKIDHILIGFMSAVGVAVGIALTLRPELKDFRISPYFWVLIAMAVFELANVVRTQMAPGSIISMEARLFAFVFAIVLMVAIPLLAGPLLQRA
jgi:uncharacterized membrane protein HdeD (DUF308 family)